MEGRQKQERDTYGRFKATKPELSERQVKELKWYYNHDRLDFKKEGGNTYHRTWKLKDIEIEILIISGISFIIGVIGHIV